MPRRALMNDGNVMLARIELCTSKQQQKQRAILRRNSELKRLYDEVPHPRGDSRKLSACRFGLPQHVYL
jgi:hypothetical protein